jgi:biopolymer transport protein ExbD
MAEKRRFLDVWIVETNTVYREVPFTVVTDWVQQGRLLADDKVRSSGTAEWHLLGKVRALAAYLPQAEPQRVEDRAEALEPVEVEFTWKRPDEKEDEDVDMIPLIDISLVLLIFFMMTAAVQTGLFSPINTPAAKYKTDIIGQDMYWIGIDIKDANGKIHRDANGKPIPWYSLGQDTKRFEEPAQDRKQALAGLEQRLKDRKESGEVRVRIRADRSLPYDLIQGVLVDLQKLEGRLNQARAKDKRQPLQISGEVSEPQSK